MTSAMPAAAVVAFAAEQSDRDAVEDEQHDGEHERRRRPSRRLRGASVAVSWFVLVEDAQALGSIDGVGAIGGLGRGVAHDSRP